MVERQHVAAVAMQRVALGARASLRLDARLLGEAGVEEADQRNVEAVEPDDRIGAVVAVVVEGPRRRDDEVAVAHRRPLAVDRGVRAFAVENETQRRLGVAMRRRDLARQDQLQPGVERLGDARPAAQRRVLEDEDTALGFLGADQPARFQHVRPDLVVAEVDRCDRASRLGRNEGAQHLPERRHAQLVDALVEGAPLGALRRIAARVAIHRGIFAPPCKPAVFAPPTGLQQPGSPMEALAP